MSERHVVVQFNRGTFPVWSDGAGRVTDRAGPLELPMSDPLREHFRSWAAEMERLMRSRADRPLEFQRLNRVGRRLAEQLSNELGSGYCVEYFDEESGGFVAT